jgi:limonene-1,2-epoxide hydrolase
MSAKFETMKALIAAWSAGDIDGALAHMSDDIVWHYAAAVAPPLKGKEKARKFLTRFKSEITEVRWRLFDYAERGDKLFVEGVDEFTTTDGHLVAAPYAGVLEFRGDLIRDWRDYVDMGVMEAQKRGEGRSAWVTEMIERPAL